MAMRYSPSLQGPVYQRTDGSTLQLGCWRSHGAMGLVSGFFGWSWMFLFFFELFSSHMTLETWALLQLLGENRRDGTLPLPVADCSSRWQLGALPVLTIATRRSWRSWRNWAKMIQDDPQLPQILWFLFEVTHDSEHSWLSTSLNPPVWRFLLMWKRRPVEGVFGLPRCLFCWESKQNQKFGMSDAASQLCHFPFTKLLNIKYSFFLSGITLKIWKARCVGETTPYAHKHILQQVET